MKTVIAFTAALALGTLGAIATPVASHAQTSGNTMDTGSNAAGGMKGSSMKSGKMSGGKMMKSKGKKKSM